MNAPPTVVGIYLRVSTEEQRERQSIQTQREFGTRYCDLHKFRIEREYADDGVSGTVPLELRPEGRQILADARDGKINQVLVYKLDRLGRETRSILNSVAELEKYGVRVRSMTEEFDTATASGRLMLTMLSGFAAHEREVIRERSVAGSNRLARSGAWLGGIVPFGYRKQGDKGEARLILSTEPIPVLGITEVDVIRSIYQMAGVERKSCFAIADHLNALGVPCAYTRDDRMLIRGKRHERTSGLWRPARVRNLIVSTTYMGRHTYGKRTKNKERALIVRDVPEIVSEEIWQKAQEVLESNRLFDKRNLIRQYLLRGVAKCGLCGLTFIGYGVKRPSGKIDIYYRCNGKHGTRGLYGEKGTRCPSKDINGTYLEDLVWGDIEQFLRNPEEVLDELQSRMTGPVTCRARPQTEGMKAALAGKSLERDKVVALYRRGLINEAALEQQLIEVEKEEAALRQQIEIAQDSERQRAQEGHIFETAQALLATMRERLDQTVSWELKRQFVKVLVAGIQIDTLFEDGEKHLVVNVSYRFASSVETCTGSRSCRHPMTKHCGSGTPSRAKACAR
jgi:site-specific DNA recombinase